MKYISIITEMVDVKPMTLGKYAASVKCCKPPKDPSRKGFKIVHEDGTQLWIEGAPSATMCKNGCMTFSMALDAILHGKKATRIGWSNKDTWICVPLDVAREVPSKNIWGKANAEYAEKNGGKVKVDPYISLKKASGSIVMGWLPSQEDIFATDWQIVE